MTDIQQAVLYVQGFFSESLDTVNCKMYSEIGVLMNVVD